MYKIKEFFYKFFNPRGLISFRSISFFLALLIFIIEALILFFPTYNTLSRRPALYAKSNECRFLRRNKCFLWIFH